MISEVYTLRSQVASNLGVDDAWALRCAKIEMDKESVGSKYKESDKHLATARRAEMENNLLIQGLSRDDGKYIIRSEHAQIIQTKEEDLVVDTRHQLTKDHVAIKRQAAEAVDVGVSEPRATISRVVEDRQHFVEYKL